ncbi:MAG: pyridoxamine 5'-phosphate oxidase family protein [Chloroflexi bacterium]|nr:pyridoxamine 5'-phosphate oxidase family protein [Chloroflexota bacterium]MCI0577301.1 pyridoxamine 5'-phosphate oxidase family protein [Chloroflexota bacterium]MCI0647745.1 pyridoxamine 5'-phosphate oxidase family protein [Chloroflexota bacterium]MCI0731609.1 pyridoxamine 5'-phosphate oxidase family protein [Chloroflexota bacterium]
MSQESEAVRQAALAYLAGHQVVTLATTGPLGLWAAAVFYASDGFELVFLSAGHTRHGQNLAANPRAAATIQEDYRDWPEIKGIQLEGPVRQLAGAERAAAIALYQAKYPFVAAADAPLQSALARVNWYRLTPDRLYFIDNSKGLGHRDEVII